MRMFAAACTGVRFLVHVLNRSVLVAGTFANLVARQVRSGRKATQAWWKGKVRKVRSQTRFLFVYFFAFGLSLHLHARAFDMALQQALTLVGVYVCLRWHVVNRQPGTSANLVGRQGRQAACNILTLPFSL